MPDTDLYNKYLKLCSDNEAFYSAEQDYKNYTMVSFTYRLASYSDFLNPLALECRGITFCIDKENGNVYLFARPFEKFFNYTENPFTAPEVIDKLRPVRFMEKLDGSMVMVGMLPNGEILAKTKTSINSEQAIRANELIQNNKDLKQFCIYWTTNGFTPIFEYTAPDNCIVIRYPEEKLTLIALRGNYFGGYINIHDPKLMGNLQISDIPIVKEYDTNLEEITLLQQDSTKNIEGWVVLFDNGQRVKFKTLDYVRKHRVKDSITNKKHLADLILNEGIDDILPLFEGDQATLDYIESFRQKITYTYKNIYHEIWEFWHDNRYLDRKSYAISAQKVLGSKMCMAMNLYLERDMGLKDYFMKNELYKTEKDEEDDN